MNLLINIIVWLVLFVPTVLEAALDYREHKKREERAKKDPNYKPKGDNHVGDLVMRGALMVVMGIIAHFIDPQYMWWQGSILSLGIFIMFFDFIMGYLLTKNPLYLGKTSQTDRKLVGLSGFATIFCRGILFASAVTTYYQLEKVIGYVY